jgi:ketosteroid isomerase-like protein
VLSDDLQAFFDSYREAFDRLDADAVARHYHVPSMLIDGDTCLIWTTEDQVLSNMRALTDHYRSDGFDHATFEARDVIQLHRDSAIVDISWVIDRAGAPAKRQFGTAYNLKRDEHGWRITVCTAYEERAARR